MNFEGEEKMFTQSISTLEQEKRKSNIYNLGEDQSLQYHLKYEMLADCIKELGKQEVKVVDYGCGEGRLTNILSTLSDCIKDLSDIKIEVIGYESDAEMVKKAIKRSKEVDFNCVRHTSEKPNKNADIVLCHFSLHHLGDDIEKILEEEIKKKINPQHLIIGEFNYKGHNIAIQEFNNLFLSTESGKDEVRRYKKQYGGEKGLEFCYNEHMKIGLQDCLDALQKIGYEVEDIVMGNMKDPTQAMKFLVKAKKAELKQRGSDLS